MGHTRSERAYMIWCMDKYRDRYIQQAEQLANDKKLTVYYREKIRIEYRIKYRRLENEIFNSAGECLSGSTRFRFSAKGGHYVESMIFNFAYHESQARDIYNREVRDSHLLRPLGL